VSPVSAPPSSDRNVNARAGVDGGSRRYDHRRGGNDHRGGCYHHWSRRVINGPGSRCHIHPRRWRHIHGRGHADRNRRNHDRRRKRQSDSNAEVHTRLSESGEAKERCSNCDQFFHTIALTPQRPGSSARKYCSRTIFHEYSHAPNRLLNAARFSEPLLRLPSFLYKANPCSLLEKPHNSSKLGGIRHSL